MTDEELENIRSRCESFIPGQSPKIAYTCAEVGGQGATCDESIIEQHLLKQDTLKLLAEIQRLKKENEQLKSEVESLQPLVEQEEARIDAENALHDMYDGLFS